MPFAIRDGNLEFAAESLATDYTGANAYIVSWGPAPRPQVALTRSGFARTPGFERVEKNALYADIFSRGKDKGGNWKAQWQPIGQGMVRFPQFFGMVKEAGFSGPLQVHFEYPLGGANDGKATLTLSREEVLGAALRQGSAPASGAARILYG